MACARLLLFAPILFFTGCRSAFVNATVHNGSGQNISLIEVDYPSASFGVQALAPSAELHYRFKILGSGPVKIVYTDTHNHEHSAIGPNLHEGLAGTLQISILSETVNWSEHLRER